MKNLSGVARSGVWSIVLQWSRLGLNAIVFIILSRWLTLSEIGLAAAAQAPILYIQQIQTSVFPDAVVQERDDRQESLSTLFWIATACGVLLSLVLLVSADSIGRLLDQPLVGSYLRAISVCPTLISLGVVLDGQLRKRLETRRLAIRTAVSSLVAGSVAIVLAYLDFGAWALVFFTLASATLGTVMLFWVEAWRPKLVFDRAIARVQAPILVSLTGRYVISAAVFPMLQLLITANLGAVAAGVFQVAQRFYQMIDSITVTPIRFLALPLFARLKDDRALLTERMVKALSVTSLTGFPAYLGMIAVSQDVLPLLVGSENGVPAIEVLRALCFYGPFALLIHLVNIALTSQGLASVVFRRALALVILTLVPCAIMTQYSVVHVGYAYSMCGGIAGVVLALVIVKRHLGIPPMRLLPALLRPGIAASIMGVLIYLLSYELSAMPAVYKLPIEVAAGSLIYAGLLFLVARPHIDTLREVAFRKRS